MGCGLGLKCPLSGREVVVYGEVAYAALMSLGKTLTGFLGREGFWTGSRFSTKRHALLNLSAMAPCPCAIQTPKSGSPMTITDTLDKTFKLVDAGAPPRGGQVNGKPVCAQ